jgi:MFS family permease
MILCLLCNCAAILALAFVNSKFIAVVFGVLIGISLPLETILIPMIVSDLIGQKSYPMVIGIFFSLATAGIAVGNPVMNLCYDLMGSYLPILVVFAFLTILALLIYLICDVTAGKYRAAEQKENF